jgi:hypothetical protein
MGMSGQRHSPAALYTRGKDMRYPLDRRMGLPHSRSGRRSWRKNSFASAGDRTSINEAKISDGIEAVKVLLEL